METWAYFKKIKTTILILARTVCPYTSLLQLKAHKKSGLFVCILGSNKFLMEQNGVFLNVIGESLAACCCRRMTPGP